MINKNQGGKLALSHPPHELFQRYLQRETMPAREKVGLRQMSESLARTLRTIERRCRTQRDIIQLELSNAEREALAEGIRYAVTDRFKFSLAYTDFVKRPLPEAYRIGDWRINSLAHEILDHGLSVLSGKDLVAVAFEPVLLHLTSERLYARLCGQDEVAVEWRRDAPALSA